MSIPLYEKTMAETQAAHLVNEAVHEIDLGAEPMEGKGVLCFHEGEI